MSYLDKYREVGKYALVGSLHRDDNPDALMIARMHIPSEIIDEIRDEPGIAILDLTGPYQETIAFSGVIIDSVDNQELIILTEVSRGVTGQKFSYPDGVELYIDQGEQYTNLIHNSNKETLKRCLRTLRQ